MAIKQKLARKAVKSTAKHTAHGTVSKLRRDPQRAVILLGLGVLVGVLVGWLVGRSSGDSTTGFEQATEPAVPGIPPMQMPTTPAAATSVTGGPS